MSEQPYLDTLRIPSPSEKDHQPFIDLIITAVDWAHKHRNAPPHITDPEADFIIYISFLTSDTQRWITRFKDAQKKAARFWRDPNTYWKAIASGVCTPKSITLCKTMLPSLDAEIYLNETSHQPTPQKIAPQPTPKPKTKPAHKRGELWKLNARWDHLWPSSRKVFLELLRRTQYPKRPDDWPWSQAGIQSLKKYTGISERQVRRALRQLERFKLIRRFVKGNTFEGASRYFVFLIPEMSGAFSHATRARKKHPPQKKRTARIR